MDTTISGVETRPAPRGRVAPRTVLIVASFGAFLAFLDATIVNVAFPSIRASFPDSSVSTLSWVLNAYNIVFAAFLVPFGRVTDLLGRKRSFVWGVAVFTIASVVCAAAPTVELLVGARMVQAVGAALLVPASLALVVQAHTPEHRTHAVGLWGASAALASGLGPPIGGALVEVGGWRWAFLVNLPFGIVAYLVARRSLVESRAPGRRRWPDLRGALLFAGALGVLTLGLVQGNDWGWTSVAVIASFVLAVLLLAGFVQSSRLHRSPLLDPTLLRLPAFTVGSVATVLAGMGFFAYLLTNVLWLTYIWQYSVLAAGLALVPGALVAAVVAAVAGPYAARFGYRPFVVVGAVLWALGYVWYATRVGTEPSFLAEWLPGQVLSGLGVGLTLPLLGSAALTAVPGGQYATASGVVSSARQVGGVLGIAVLVVIIGTPTAATAVTTLRQGWWWCVACFLACALCSLWLGRPTPAAEPLPDEDLSRVDIRLPESAPVPAGQGPVAAVPLFRRLPPAVRDRLDGAAVERRVDAGELLLRVGDEADSMYVVRTGRLEVLVGDEVVRELGAGTLVGELALLAGGRRSATIRARRDSTVAEVSQAAFQSAMAHEPRAYAELATVLAEQLQDDKPVRPPARSRPRVVAVLGLHGGAPTAAVGAALVAAAGVHVRTIALDQVDPESLHRAEQDGDLVVLTVEAGQPGWQEARRQADRVVAVAAAGSEPPPVAADLSGADLVLVGDRPSEARLEQWCTHLDPWQVSVVPRAAAPELRMLAARLTGRAVGVVMAGGGARALAHVGVLQELSESGIVVDRVAGCSLGSIVAGLYAAGADGDEVADVVHDEFVRRNPFSDYTIPTVSLARGRRARRALDTHMGGREIRALPRQFRCVSVDLLRRSRVTHRAGDLAGAVAASISLPVLFPPYHDGDRLLVDGGVLDNLPVGLLTEREEGPLLAVNVATAGGGAPRSGPPRVPGLGDTLMRTMMIGSAGAVESALAQGATVITPAPRGVGLLEFHQLDTMVESGRAAVRALLERTGGTFPASPT